MSIAAFIAVFVQFFCLLTPFFVLGMFIVMTDGMSHGRQRKTALKTTAAILCICLLIYFLGGYLFDILGITLDAFRIGAGAILFITAVNVVLDRGKNGPVDAGNPSQDNISVVPLAIPFTVGPGTIGAIMVMSTETHGFAAHLVACAGISAAVLATGILLYLASLVEKLVGSQGIKVLSKLTGLILAALAAQIIFTGTKNFLGL